MKPDVNLNLYNNSICSILDDVIALGEAARRLRADITQELHHAPPRMALVETDGLIGCVHLDESLSDHCVELGVVHGAG